MNITLNRTAIRHLMIDRGITSFAQLADMAGINKNTMGRTGPFNSTTLGKLCEALDCEPLDILSVSREKRTPPPTSAEHPPPTARPNASITPPPSPAARNDKPDAEEWRRTGVFLTVEQRRENRRLQAMGVRQ